MRVAAIRHSNRPNNESSQQILPLSQSLLASSQSLFLSLSCCALCGSSAAADVATWPFITSAPNKARRRHRGLYNGARRQTSPRHFNARLASPLSLQVSWPAERKICFRARASKGRRQKKAIPRSRLRGKSRRLDWLLCKRHLLVS